MPGLDPEMLRLQPGVFPYIVNLGLVFYFYFFVLYCIHRVIRRPSDHPVPRFELGTGNLVAGTLTTRPPHLLVTHKDSVNENI